MRVLIFGAYGFLGTRFREYIKGKEIQIYCQGRGESSEIRINPVNELDVKELTRKISPDLILNLVAKTNVDQCEENFKEAFEANVVVVQNIAKAIEGKNIKFIHISTDQLYSGKGPHKEGDINPINKYASTKRLGELAASGIHSTVLRTNFVGKSLVPGRVSFTDWVFDGLKTKKNLFLFDDVFFSPLCVNDLCSAVWAVMKNPLPGIFNLGCHGGISKADFGIAFAKKLGFDPGNIQTGKAGKFPLMAKRPSDMRMDSTQFVEKYNYNLPTILETIDSCCGEYVDV